MMESWALGSVVEGRRGDALVDRVSAHVVRRAAWEVVRCRRHMDDMRGKQGVVGARVTLHCCVVLVAGLGWRCCSTQSMHGAARLEQGIATTVLVQKRKRRTHTEGV